MLCVSVNADNFNDCLKAVSEFDLVELRLDHHTLSDTQLNLLFTNKAEIIACCRPGHYDDKSREVILKTCIDKGAKYIDIETESTETFKKNIREYAALNHSQLIYSYHNHELTPTTKNLKNIINQCIADKAAIIKIACKVNSTEDNIRLISLYKLKIPLISIGMGEKGKITRLASLFLNAPFTYTSLSKEKETAPGQIDYKTMQTILNLMH